MNIKFFIFHDHTGQWVLERHSEKNKKSKTDVIGQYQTYDEARGVYLWHMESYSEAEEMES